MTPPVVVVGAGLAGLACARRLSEAGRPVTLLEKSDAPGGRVRTDLVDGFRLDRGFQVLLTAYPEARRQLDYDELDLRTFFPGAAIYLGGKLHRVADAFRVPFGAMARLINPIGSLRDKLRVLALRTRARAGTLEELFARPQTTTLASLRGFGFSQAMIDRFFRPWFGGMFAGRDLTTSSRMMEFVVRMMSEGDVAIPAAGMGAITQQLAAQLPAGVLRLDASVAAVRPDGVLLEHGEHVPASAVVVATEGDVASRLTAAFPPPSPRAVTTLYYSAEYSPLPPGLLALNGESKGPVHSVCVPSDVSPRYAPEGRSLVSVTVLGLPADTDHGLDASARAQLTGWFGQTVRAWQYLRTYRIPWSQPEQAPPNLEPPERPVRLTERLFVAGDHRDQASINGALVSGRRAADAVLESTS